MIMNSTGHCTKNDCAGEDQQQITQLTEQPSSSNELLQDSQGHEREKFGHESCRTQNQK
jgi:hypothetical protein